MGDPDRLITRLAPLETAQPTELSYLVNPRLAQQLASTQAGCVIVGPAMAEAARSRGDCIVCDDPHLYFARVTQLWRRLHHVAPRSRIHPSAVVEEGAFVHPTALVGALSFVGRGARIGADTVIKERVTIGEDCVLGARCLVQSGAVIGGDGCVDRGALDDTVIEDGVKLDNLIQIGHNTHIGKHTAMAGCVGVAGSARIGAYCTVGGAGMIAGHLSIADHVHVSAGSLVSRSITKPGHYTGFFPIDDNGEWEKNAATLRQLHRLRERVRQLERLMADSEE